MIRERPGEKNDRELVISNIDNDRHQILDHEKTQKNHDRIFGHFVPDWYRETFEKTGIPLSEALKEADIYDPTTGKKKNIDNNE